METQGKFRHATAFVGGTMATKVQRNVVREIVLLSGMVCSVLPPSFARADECGDSWGPGSCYILEPSLALVTQGTVSVPAGHPIPYHWREATKSVPPPAAKPEEYISKPGLDLSLAAGV